MTNTATLEDLAKGYSITYEKHELIIDGRIMYDNPDSPRQANTILIGDLSQFDKQYYVAYNTSVDTYDPSVLTTDQRKHGYIYGLRFRIRMRENWDSVIPVPPAKDMMKTVRKMLDSINPIVFGVIDDNHYSNNGHK